MDIWELIKIVSISLVMAISSIFAMIKLFGKNILNHLLHKDIERYKSELTERTEVLKSQLSIYANERSISYSRVDNQRATAISKIHSSMIKWNKSVTRIIAPFPLVNVEITAVYEFYNALGEEINSHSKLLSETLVDNSIYFSEAMYEAISSLSKNCLTMSAEFLQYFRMSSAEGIDWKDFEKTLKVSREILTNKYYSQYISNAQSIISSFRVLLGISK